MGFLLVPYFLRRSSSWRCAESETLEADLYGHGEEPEQQNEEQE